LEINQSGKILNKKLITFALLNGFFPVNIYTKTTPVDQTSHFALYFLCLRICGAENNGVPLAENFYILFGSSPTIFLARPKSQIFKTFYLVKRIF
jgi:hypothetical protein